MKPYPLGSVFASSLHMPEIFQDVLSLDKEHSTKIFGGYFYFQFLTLFGETNILILDSKPPREDEYELDPTFLRVSNAHYFLSNRNTVTYNTGLQCYIMWVRIECASTIVTSVFSVDFLFLVWPTVFPIKGVVQIRNHLSTLYWNMMR